MKTKRGDTYNRRFVLHVLQDRGLAYILFEELRPKFAERNSGSARIIEPDNRKGGNAALACIGLVMEKVLSRQPAVYEAEKTSKKVTEAQKLVKEAKESANAEEAAETAADVVESKEANETVKKTAAGRDAAETEKDIKADEPK